MNDDPPMAPAPSVLQFSPKLLPMWIAASKQPEADVRLRVAQTIAEVHGQGMTISPEAVSALVALLEDSHPAVRQAAAMTLVSVDAKGAADALHARSLADGADVAVIVEPALARWNHAPARDVWRARLQDPATPLRLRVLAMRGLGEVKDANAGPALVDLATDRFGNPTVRLEAAAAGEAIGVNIDASVRSELSAGNLVDRLVAAHLAPATAELLQEIARDDEPTVAAVALRRLLKTDPSWIKPIEDLLLGNADANVRTLTAQAVLVQNTPQAITKLGVLLDDPHPDLRNLIRTAFHKLDNDAALSPAVRGVIERSLADAQWRGKEQAAILAGQLDHEPVAQRLVELLDHDRPEVYIASAWALQKLAVSATLEGMAAKLEREVQQYFSAQAKQPKRSDVPPMLLDPDKDRQLSQLIQGLCLMQHKQVDATLRRFIPKGTFGTESRTAAVWALGKFHEGQATKELISAFRSRLVDVNPLDPELSSVRRMAAVGLGRMKSDMVATLRNFYKQEAGMFEVGTACKWAIEQLTGEDLPELEPIIASPSGYFLEPMD